MDTAKGAFTAEFNEEASRKREGSVFFDYLKNMFGTSTALKVVDCFEKLQVPVPQTMDEVVCGKDGCVLLLNDYGLVIRVEREDLKRSCYSPSRIDDNAWVLKPLATFLADIAQIEICPGTHQEVSSENVQYLEKTLRALDIEYWDFKISNTGRVPVNTTRFPEGVPVVIDRGAVKRLTNNTKSVRDALEMAQIKKDTEEAEQAIDALYAPLREALDAAWPKNAGAPDPQKIEKFWELCRSYYYNGYLAAGWNEPQSAEARDEICIWGDNSKTQMAACAALRYQEKLRR